MVLDQSSNKKAAPKGHLRNESMLKALPPDILQELARRRLEEIERARKNLAEKEKRP
jgi:DNA-binding TFAR19-related protein (PDSD5 family)